MHFQGGPERQPLRGAEGGHVREVSHIPEHDVLLLDALVVLVIPELPAGSKGPWEIFIRIGPSNGDVEVRKGIALPVVFERGVPVSGENPHTVSCELVAHEPGPVSG